MYLRFENIFNHDYNLAYIEEAKISLESLYSIKVNLVPKEIPYQISYEDRYLDLDKNFQIQGISKRDELKILILNTNTKKNYGEVIDIKKDDIRLIEKLANLLKEFEIDYYNMVEIKDSNIYLYSQKHTIELGKETDLEKKLTTLQSIYVEIKDLEGTLYLNEYKSDDSSYRFKNKKK